MNGRGPPPPPRTVGPESTSFRENFGLSKAEGSRLSALAVGGAPARGLRGRFGQVATDMVKLAGG
jgi:hypothetical protein